MKFSAYQPWFDGAQCTHAPYCAEDFDLDTAAIPAPEGIRVGDRAHAYARAICEGCPVVIECMNYALVSHIKSARSADAMIYGGVAPQRSDGYGVYRKLSQAVASGVPISRAWHDSFEPHRLGQLLWLYREYMKPHVDAVLARRVA